GGGGRWVGRLAVVHEHGCARQRGTGVSAGSDVAATASQRPRPEPDNVSRRYFEAAAGGELIVQRCLQCGRYQFYPRRACTACGGDPEWVPASGRGVLHTYTVIHQNRTPPFAELTPYVVGIVELEEGVRMMSNVIDCELEDVHVGMPLVVD